MTRREHEILDELADICDRLRDECFQGEEPVADIASRALIRLDALAEQHRLDDATPLGRMVRNARRRFAESRAEAAKLPSVHPAFLLSPTRN